MASDIKKLQQERIGAPSCGWTGEGGTLQTLLPITQATRGVGGNRDGEAFYANNNLDFFIVIKTYENAFLTCINNS